MAKSEIDYLIEADGNYKFPLNKRGARVALTFAGDYGGGSLAVNSRDVDGNETPFRDDAGDPIEFIANGGIEVASPTSVISVTLTGSSAPSIRVTGTELE